MLEAKQGKEIVLSVKNEIGLLFELSKLLAEKGVGILAINATVCGEECVIRLVTDDNLRTRDALVDKGYAADEEDVILVEVLHKPGMLKRVTEVMAGEKIDVHHAYATAFKRVTEVMAGEKIDVHHAYATASEDQEKCLLVLHSANDEHVLPKLHQLVAV